MILATSMKPERQQQEQQRRLDDIRSMMRLTDRVRETASALHRYLRHGHFEEVYSNALAHRLEKQGLRVDRQVPLMVYDEDGTELGTYIAGMVIEGSLLVEVKACSALNEEHAAHLHGYLRGCRLQHGLLINFGCRRLQIKQQEETT